MVVVTKNEVIDAFHALVDMDTDYLADPLKENLGLVHLLLQKLLQLTHTPRLRLNTAQHLRHIHQEFPLLLLPVPIAS